MAEDELPDIAGLWGMRYALRQREPFGNEEGDPEEAGEFNLENGRLSGIDPWGFEYLGFYTVVDKRLTASVISSPYRNDAFSILDGTNRRIHIEFEGEYNSPNYVALRGREVSGDPDAEIVINCRRK